MNPGCLNTRRLLALTLVALTYLLRFNFSASMPCGLYCRLPLQSTRSGDLVTLCLPPDAAALYKAHSHSFTGSCPEPTRLPPFLKLVAAIGGDRVTFGPEGLILTGRLLPLSAPRFCDSAGRPLPHAPFGAYRLPPGSLWLYAPHPDSFDSRYFGPLQATTVLSRMVPLWVLTKPPSSLDRLLRRRSNE